MPIQFSPEHKIFKLDTATTTYALQIGQYGYLLHLYLLFNSLMVIF